MTNDSITIYTDGACSGNPGPGGWAATIRQGNITREIFGGFAQTTNNRMELHAVIAALKTIANTNTSSAITLYSDSRYVVDMITKGHAQRWQKNGWMRDHTHLALNSDLWKQLLPLSQEMDIQFIWVKGHDGQSENERVDQLAVEAYQQKDLPTDEGFANPALFPSDSLFG